MEQLKDDLKVSNLMKFKRYAEKFCGGPEVPAKLIETLGGDEVFMNATFGMALETGSAYNGALLLNAFEVGRIASELNKMLPESAQAPGESIWKVALLQHIAKTVMYALNDNEWEVSKRGYIYMFNPNDNNCSLKCGEYSAMLAQNAGITFTKQEYEAMRILDKVRENIEGVLFTATPLATIIRQANELVTMKNKIRARELAAEEAKKEA